MVVRAPPRTFLLRMRAVARGGGRRATSCRKLVPTLLLLLLLLSFCGKVDGAAIARRLSAESGGGGASSDGSSGEEQTAVAHGAAVAERGKAVARVLALERAVVAAHEVAELVAVAALGRR